MLTRLALDGQTEEKVIEVFANYVLAQIGTIEDYESSIRDYEALGDGFAERINEVENLIKGVRSRIDAAYNIASTVFGVSTYGIEDLVQQQCVEGMKRKREKELEEEVRKEVQRLTGR